MQQIGMVTVHVVQQVKRPTTIFLLKHLKDTSRMTHPHIMMAISSSQAFMKNG